jgi:peptidoglycan/LPS O-acetylase OafA/YrhL
VGVGLSWLWQEGLQEFTFRHKTRRGAAVSYALSLIALSLLAAVTFGRVAFFQAGFEELGSVDTNPAGKWSIYAYAALSPLAWALGIGIIMILCFQQRFLPALQNLLNSTAWQPFAKLSYAMYLVHTSVLILDFCQQEGMISYTNSSFFFKYSSALLMTMFAALVLHLGFEKPVANMQMKLFGGAE